ncbi:3-hydroxyacyl-ACP dehydratase FabZ family protein [Pseudoalteromonas phenolica]|uniref:3-hydroxyacyl-ACP dehydratase FabZ family protein n=1 Tax=Pseudoalteromonas phenolica TaxID=161398 RepID=UPI00110BBEFF|nr:FabA/FabZ family ACP-dehydratase [Pseudoalteromonas phenolica]TMO57474.1 hypothetical protein CWC21_02765 [Pseudoalteromonas phenolica]
MNKKNKADLSELLDIQDPFLMIDAYELIEAGQSAIGVKHLDAQDWFFQCHLPKSGVMPGTMQIEGMLQTLVLLIYDSFPHGENRALVNEIKVKLLSTITVKSSTEIKYEARIISMRRGICKGEVKGFREGELICSGEFTYASPHLMATPKLT